MADLKMPEVNSVVIAGNLTRDPVCRQTTNGSTVVRFSIALNRRYRDANNRWQEEATHVGVVAWNRLAGSCVQQLRRGSAVLIEGEVQSHVFKNDDGIVRNVVEVRARRVQFLNKRYPTDTAQLGTNHQHHDEELSIVEDDSFDKFLSSEEAQLLKEQSPNHT